MISSMVFKKGQRPANAFPKGIYQGFGFKKGNKLGFTKGHNRQSGEKNSRFKGKILRAGYYHIFKPEHPFCNKGKRVQEHRLVVEKYIGRYLEPKECVHHINEIKTDNRIENLILFKDNASHVRYHYFYRDFCKTQNPKHLDKVLSQAGKAMGIVYIHNLPLE